MKRRRTTADPCGTPAQLASSKIDEAMDAMNKQQRRCYGVGQPADVLDRAFEDTMRLKIVLISDVSSRPKPTSPGRWLSTQGPP